MSLQAILVGIVALAAAGYLSRQAWRTWTGNRCSGGCCKNAPPSTQTPHLIQADELLGRWKQP
jgi:hypothetical protein